MTETQRLPQTSFLQHVAPADDTTLTHVTPDNTTYPFTPSPSVFIPCDNPHNVVSPFVAETVEIVVYVGMFPVLVTCGVITNVINMVVFARQGLSNRINVSLFSLAMSDTGCLLAVMMSKSYALISLISPVAGIYWQSRHNSFGLGIYLAFLAISNTITTIVSVERCLCVLSPLKAAKSFRTRHMVVLIVLIALYIVVVKNVGLHIKYQTVEVTDPLTNTSTYISRLSPFYVRHRTIIDIIYNYLVSVTLLFLSLVVVIVCTTAIIIRLKVSADWRRRSVSNMASMDKQEVMVTRMLVTVCCVYVMCMIPSVTRVMLFSRLPGFLSTGHLCNIYRVTTAFTLLLEASNSAVNFLIYVKQSSQYRATLRQLLSWCRPGGRKAGVRDQHHRQRGKQSQTTSGNP